MRICILSLIVSFLIISCKDDILFIPKPRMYPKVNYPVKEYQNLDIKTCPFEMETPSYFTYIKDTVDIGAKQNDCWFDLYCGDLNAYFHFSYLPIENRKHFDKLVSDAFELVDKHNIKADYREEIKISQADKNVHGLIFEIEGPVATPLQFFVTDSTEHFFRGSLYFKSKVNRDSIAPVYTFLKEDMVHLLSSFEWKK